MAVFVEAVALDLTEQKAVDEEVVEEVGAAEFKEGSSATEVAFTAGGTLVLPFGWSLKSKSSMCLAKRLSGPRNSSASLKLSVF